MKVLSLFGAVGILMLGLPVLSTTSSPPEVATIDYNVDVIDEESGLVYADIFACPRPELILDFLAHGIGADHRECSIFSREDVNLMVPVDAVYEASYDAWFAGLTDDPGEPQMLMQLHLVKIDGLRLYGVAPVVIDEHFLDPDVIGEDFAISIGLNRSGVAYELWPTTVPGTPGVVV